MYFYEKTVSKEMVNFYIEILFKVMAMIEHFIVKKLLQLSITLSFGNN